MPASGHARRPASRGIVASIPPSIPSQGGSLDRLRDGGINGANYVYNPTGAASFAGRLDDMVAALDRRRAFDRQPGLDRRVSVIDFGTASVGWLEDQRQTAADLPNTRGASSRAPPTPSPTPPASTSTTNTRLQLQLEQSYQAASKLIGVVNELFKTLLDAVR